MQCYIIFRTYYEAGGPGRGGGCKNETWERTQKNDILVRALKRLKIRKCVNQVSQSFYNSRYIISYTYSHVWLKKSLVEIARLVNRLARLQ